MNRNRRRQISGSSVAVGIEEFRFIIDADYIAYYTIFPRAIGGRLYSDAIARFILFVVVAMPIGVHHLFGPDVVGDREIHDNDRTGEDQMEVAGDPLGLISL
jgi:hypothetical protein